MPDISMLVEIAEFYEVDIREMLCCGFTMASIILIESSDVKISLWFAAIPLAMTVAYSVLLVINAKRYIHK